MRPVWRLRLTRGAIIGGLTLALALALALGWFVSPLGRNWVASTILSAVAGDGSARYETIAGPWPGRLVLGKVTLADREGPWLTLDRVSLSWRPLALLGGTLRITALSLDKPVLLRQPKPSASPPSGSGGVPAAPPLAILLDTLTVSGGLLQDGAPISFDGRASARWTKRQIALDAALQRRDGADEHLMLKAGVDRAARRVTLDADARAAPGGLFARLAGVADLPAFRLRASGTGPAEDWRFQLAGAFGDWGALDLGGTLAWTEDLVLAGTGELRPGPALGPSWRAALGKALALNLRLSRQKQADSAMVTLKGDTADIALDAKLGGRALQGAARIRTSASTDFGASTSVGPVTLDATLGGTLDRPSAALAFAFDGARYGSYRVAKFDGAVDVKPAPGGAVLLSGQGGVGTLTARDRPVFDTARWTLAGTKRGDVLRDLQLVLMSAPLALEAKGGLDLSSGALRLDTAVTATDLNAITPIAHVRLAGEAALQLTYARDKRGADASITLTGQITHGAVAGQALAPFAGEALHLDAALTQRAGGTLTMEKGLIAGDRLNASLSGRVEPALDLPIALATDLSALGALAGIEARGRVEGRLHARGTLDDPKLALDLTSREAVLMGRALGALTIAFTPDEKAAIPAGRLRLVAKGPPGGMDLTIPVAEDGAGLLILGPLNGAAYGAQLAGTLRETPEAWAGRLDAGFTDLSGIYALATGTPMRVAGRGGVTLVLGPSTDLSATLALRDVTAEDRRLAAARLSLKASRKGNSAQLALSGQELRLPGPMGPIDARGLALQGSGPLENFGWHLTADGITGPRGTLDSRGTFESKPAGDALALAALSGTLWSTPVALESPARLTLGRDGTQLSPLGLKIGTGRLQLGFAAHDKGQKGDLAVSGLPLTFLGRVLGTDWPQGRITGQAGFDTLAARPHGAADLQFSDALFSRQGQAVAEPLSGQFTASWDGRALAIKGEAARLAKDGTHGPHPIQLEARLPLIRKPGGSLGFDPHGALSGEVHWAGRLGTLWALFPYDLHRLDGSAVLDGRASGRWGAPRLEGTLRVERGTYESLMTGTRLRDIGLRIDAGPAGGEAAIEGGDGRGGTFSGRGHLDFGEAAAIKADVALNRLRIVGLDRLTAEASGPLALRGSLQAPELSGKLRIDHVDATIPDRLPPSIPQLPVRYIDEIDVTIPQFEEPAARGNATLALALDIDIPGQAFLRGRGLTSEWRGRVKVEGTSLAPRILGQVELARGQIAFAGRSYELARGRVNFDGSTKIDPTLDIAATRTVEGTEIALALSGPSSAPRLDLTATPALPRDQAMSLFLFGKSAQSLTTLELLDVARSVAALTGTTGAGFDPIEKTRRALGLDILTVGVGSGKESGSTAGNLASSATVEAGRYVSKRVYLGVKQGARAGSSAVQLNYALTPHLSAGTEVGVESGGQLNVNWKWDY